MGNIVENLEEVEASALPARVLVLLSKYAQALRKHNGLVIKLSSMNVFRHVHSTSRLATHPSLKQIYQELLDEVNTHLEQGTMQTSQNLEASRKRFLSQTPSASAENLNSARQ